MDPKDIQLNTIQSTVKWLVAKIDNLLEQLEQTENPEKIKELRIEIDSLHKKCIFESREIDKIIKRIDDE